MLQNLANNIGLLYRTEPDGVTVTGTFANTPEEVALAKKDAASRGPISSEIFATGNIVITFVAAGNDLINSVSVDGVNQMASATIVLDDADVPQSMRNLADDINAAPPASGPRYTAFQVGDGIVLTAPSGVGAGVNGDIVGIAFVGASTADVSPMAGGSSGGGDVDALSGARYFLNADAGAVEGDIAGSTEITESLIIKGLQGGVALELLTIAAGTIVPTRKANIQTISLTNEAAAGADFLDFIDPANFQFGDTLLIAGGVLAQVATFRDKSVSGGNILLANQANFSTGEKESNISLRLTQADGGATVWAESTRSPGVVLSGESLWQSGLPIDFGHRQEEIVAGGGVISFNVDIPLDKTHLELITNGLVVLAGNWSIQFTGAPKDGQPVEVKYNGTATKGAFAITIFGIALTEREILVGGVLITAKWDDTNSVWEFAKFYDHTKAGLIQSENIADDAVIESKLLDEAVTNSKLEDGSVSTAKVQDASITEVKIGAAAVTLDKLEVSLKEETVVVPVSFESNRQGAYSYYPPFKCILTKIKSQVVNPLSAVNDGTIQAANTVGNMANGLITHLSGAVFGDTQTVSPTSNNNVDPAGGNDHFDFTSLKGNDGGDTHLILFLTRVV